MRAWDAVGHAVTLALVCVWTMVVASGAVGVVLVVSPVASVYNFTLIATVRIWRVGWE